MRRSLITIVILMTVVCSKAQDWVDIHESSKWEVTEGLRYDVSLQTSYSDGKTPLWLNANKYGLSSLEESNGYLRVALVRPLQTDSTRRWGIGYGADAAVAYHYTSKTILQQAFVDVRWLHGQLTVGAKEQPMELKNNALSSGAQTLGINARPVPQVRLSLNDYWCIPGTKGWVRMKGHITYGMMTDDNWQKDFTSQNHKYTEKVLFHSKTGFLKIGNEDRFYPLSLELGLEMATIFGGRTYKRNTNGEMICIESRTGLNSFWHAFLPGGSEVVEEGTNYENAEGNQLGTWMARLNYDGDNTAWHLYAEKYFEDHSSMLMLDYDGYGTGDNWNVSEKHRYFVYDPKDWLLGVEINFKRNSWLQDIVFEYIYTKYQSGPIYHDHSRGNSTHISGIDDFYNHYIYTGWQHWGQVMGNPLYRSPIYNDDGDIYINDNRFMALHLGIDGEPVENLRYRLRATYREGLGTYYKYYLEPKRTFSFALDAKYVLPRGWYVVMGYGMDFGHVFGNNCGAQVTVGKSGLLNLKRKK